MYKMLNIQVAFVTFVVVCAIHVVLHIMDVDMLFSNMILTDAIAVVFAVVFAVAVASASTSAVTVAFAVAVTVAEALAVAFAVAVTFTSAVAVIFAVVFAVVFAVTGADVSTVYPKIKYRWCIATFFIQVIIITSVSTNVGGDMIPIFGVSLFVLLGSLPDSTVCIASEEEEKEIKHAEEAEPSSI